MIRAISLAVSLSLALSACGGRVKLKPQDGKSMPVKPEDVRAQPTVEEMIAPSAQANPKRSDELLKRSEERRDDKFDLPPKG
jgi:hypothetical protein